MKNTILEKINSIPAFDLKQLTNSLEDILIELQNKILSKNKEKDQEKVKEKDVK